MADTPSSDELDEIIDMAYCREADLLISEDFKDDTVRFKASKNYKAATKWCIR